MARSLNKAKKTKKEGRNSMAENIVFQILRSHLMEGELTPGPPSPSEWTRPWDMT